MFVWICKVAYHHKITSFQSEGRQLTCFWSKDVLPICWRLQCQCYAVILLHQAQKVTLCGEASNQFSDWNINLSDEILVINCWAFQTFCPTLQRTIITIFPFWDWRQSAHGFGYGFLFKKFCINQSWTSFLYTKHYLSKLLMWDFICVHNKPLLKPSTT